MGEKIIMSFIIWMTGLPCSGKTAIARKLSKHIPNLAILDGDEMREWLSPNEDFSQNGIKNHNKKVSKLVNHFSYCVVLFSSSLNITPTVLSNKIFSFSQKSINFLIYS